MSLKALPQEMLEKIAGYLDTPSWLAFGALGTIFEESTKKSAENLKLKTISRQMLEYLRVNGYVVKSLNLTNSLTPSDTLSELIMNCPNITELRLTGTMLSCRGTMILIENLEKLQTLSISVSHLAARHPVRQLARKRVLPRKLTRRELPHLKKLCLEVVGTSEAFDFCLDIMNKCPVLETAHINTIRNILRPDLGESELVPERWNTLRTVVISLFDSNGWRDSRLIGFLQRVFKYKLTLDSLLRWTNERKDCYIYENGNFNGILANSDARNRGARLLHKLQHLTVNTADGKILRLPWGSPQKLRLVDKPEMFSPHMQHRSIISRSMCSALVELDFTDLHSRALATREFLKLISGSPLLEAIAFPPCLLWGWRDQSETARILEVPLPTSSRRTAEAAFLDEALTQIRLKRFCLQGTTYSRCLTCFRTALTSCNLPDLTNLEHLEEIIFSRVNLKDDANVRLENPRLGTAKFCLWPKGCYINIPSFLESCRNLRILKLDSYDLPLESPQLWEALVRCDSVEQLCLGNADKYPFNFRGAVEMILSEDDMRTFFEDLDKLIRRLEVFHIHRTVLIKSKDASSPAVELHRYIRERMERTVDPGSGTIAERLVGPEEQSLFVMGVRATPPVFAGRALCKTESFIGQVEPEGWTMD